MKIILLQNVSNLGQKNDIKDVKTGYWRNSLLPQGLAIEATPKAMEQLVKRKEAEVEKKEYEEKQFEATLKRLGDENLIIERKADETGTLFDGLDRKELVKLISEKMRVDIPEDIIGLEKAIKKVGTHKVPIKGSVLKVEIKPASPAGEPTQE
ncbi:MAG: 50S ribosomal protein L9 [Patescibacteria group bacterium]